MLFSIGYQGRTLEGLIGELKQREIKFLVDVRSRPYGRRPEFNRSRIADPLIQAGISYIWAGQLGGFSKISETEIRNLAEWQHNKIACIMCMEKDHRQCHRDFEIGKRLQAYKVTINHI